MRGTDRQSENVREGGNPAVRRDIARKPAFARRPTTSRRCNQTQARGVHVSPWLGCGDTPMRESGVEPGGQSGSGCTKRAGTRREQRWSGTHTHTHTHTHTEVCTQQYPRCVQDTSVSLSSAPSTRPTSMADTEPAMSCIEFVMPI